MCTQITICSNLVIVLRLLVQIEKVINFCTLSRSFCRLTLLLWADHFGQHCVYSIKTIWVPCVYTKDYEVYILSNWSWVVYSINWWTISSQRDILWSVHPWPYAMHLDQSLNCKFQTSLHLFGQDFHTLTKEDDPLYQQHMLLWHLILTVIDLLSAQQLTLLWVDVKPPIAVHPHVNFLVCCIWIDVHIVQGFWTTTFWRITSLQ